MKGKIAIATLTLLVLVGACPVYADLKATPEVIEFGDLEEGLPAQKTVTLTNEGTNAIQIANVSTSCACTTTKLGQASLEPGQVTNLVITYQTYKYAGKFDKTITIQYENPNEEKTVIHLVGNVAPVPMGVINMEPRKVQVGTLKANQTNMIELQVINSGDAPLTISSVVSIKYKKILYQAGDSAITILAGEAQKVPLSVTPTNSGNFMDIILVHSEDARNDVGQGYKAVLVGQAQ